ncbi:MAG TPA: hypothetical protein PKE69_03200 [Pyrinomonadaceae bacterium]|nr:hypothetical protein [Pyrinomonadaceae bacterium]
MEKFSSILEEIIQKYGEIETSVATVAAFAEKSGVSPAQLSRIKMNKTSLTDNVINKIYEYFSNKDKEYADNLKQRLAAIKKNSSATVKTKTDFEETENSATESYSNLIKKLSQEGNLLMLEYRDFPVTFALSPKIMELSVNAIKSGLCVALFQPFGSREDLYERHNFLARRSSKIKDPNLFEIADRIVNSYDYLIRLAGKVNRLYKAIRDQLEPQEKGQIVLYEAVYKYQKENKEILGALPSIAAGGISSKMLYAEISGSEQNQTKVYEWTSIPNDNFLFMERGNTTINFNAVKMQFSPIPTYWEKYKKLPDTPTKLNEAYAEFGFLKLFGEEETVKWKIWTSK